MMIQEIIDTLKTHPGLVARVGDRIYPFGIPPDTVQPAITYSLISDREVSSKDGPTGLHSGTFRFVVWSQSQDEGRQIVPVIGEALVWLRRRRILRNAVPGSASDDVFADPFAWLSTQTYTIWWKE